VKKEMCVEQKTRLRRNWCVESWEMEERCVKERKCVWRKERCGEERNVV
jgi:hypothetical protein